MDYKKLGTSLFSKMADEKKQQRCLLWKYFEKNVVNEEVHGRCKVAVLLN